MQTIQSCHWSISLLYQRRIWLFCTEWEYVWIVANPKSLLETTITFSSSCIRRWKYCTFLSLVSNWGIEDMGSLRGTWCYFFFRLGSWRVSWMWSCRRFGEEEQGVRRRQEAMGVRRRSSACCSNWTRWTSWWRRGCPTPAPMCFRTRLHAIATSSTSSARLFSIPFHRCPFRKLNPCKHQDSLSPFASTEFSFCKMSPSLILRWNFKQQCRSGEEAH